MRGVTGKFVLGAQNEAGQRLIVFCQENALVIAKILFQQHKRRLYTWTSLDDGGSDHPLLIAKFRPKLKKVRKITRPFRYELNQISYELYSESDE